MIDLRSDTVTKPTTKMREAMFHAEVGDDCYGEDPTVNALEAYAAERIGKEAAVYVPTGTMGNTAAILAHTQPADLILVDKECHIYYYEHGNMSSFGGVMPVLSDTASGCPEPAFIEPYLQRDPRRFPRVSLICVENTHNRRGGQAVSLESMAALHEVACRYDTPVHLDGARVFNAAHALGVDVRDIAAQVDSIMFCLSKGLCAPVGSILAGSADFIARARRARKQLGGSMRQAGVLAAAGLVALREMTERLVEDHAKAQILAQGFAEFESLAIDPERIDTNIVILDTGPLGMAAPEFAQMLQKEGVQVSIYGPTMARFVTHHDVSESEVIQARDIACRAIHRCLGENP